MLSALQIVGCIIGGLWWFGSLAFGWWWANRLDDKEKQNEKIINQD